MATTTNQITQKLRFEFADKFMPIAESLRKEGQSDYEIVKCFNDYMKQETFRFYRKKHFPGNIKDSIKRVLEKDADSKIELIYCGIFYREMIPFEFQYKIGKFRADFLIDKWLVFEIDGPQHDKNYDGRRDKYMRNLGYEVFRVPAWLASTSHDAVIEEIKELIRGNNAKGKHNTKSVQDN